MPAGQSGLAEGMLGGQQPAYDSAQAAADEADLETTLHWTEAPLADPDTAADAAAAAGVATCKVDRRCHGSRTLERYSSMAFHYIVAFALTHVIWIDFGLV